MKVKTFVSKNILIFGTLIVCFACFQQIQGQRINIKLSRARIIYVEPTGKEVNKNDFSDILKTEFKRYGFAVADIKDNADAILTLKKFSAVITLDGTKDDKDKSFYDFELSLRSGEIIWRKTAKFLTKGTGDENHRTAAQKIAELFYYDKAKADKKSKSTKEK